MNGRAVASTTAGARIVGRSCSSAGDNIRNQSPGHHRRAGGNDRKILKSRSAHGNLFIRDDEEATEPLDRDRTYHVERRGDDHRISALSILIGEYVAEARVAVVLGALVSVFALPVPRGATLWALSDRYGRKPILIISLLGSGIGYALEHHPNEKIIRPPPLCSWRPGWENGEIKNLRLTTATT